MIKLLYKPFEFEGISVGNVYTGSTSRHEELFLRAGFCVNKNRIKTKKKVKN